MHEKQSELAGKEIILKDGATHPQFPNFGGNPFVIEDWWDRVHGKSWMVSNGNPAALVYAMRSALQNPTIPADDEVLYGKLGDMGCLIHVSEIGEIIK